MDTDVTSLTALTSGLGGNIQIDEKDGIILTSVTTADGSITVNAGGPMTAAVVTAGGTGRNVTLTTTAGGAIAAGTITAAGDLVTLTSAGAITGGDGDTTAVNVTANDLSASAAGAITLDTDVSNITATTSAAGAITLAEKDAVTLTNVNSNNGADQLTCRWRSNGDERGFHNG